MMFKKICLSKKTGKWGKRETIDPLSLLHQTELQLHLESYSYKENLSQENGKQIGEGGSCFRP
jgi:hypothetical protein